MKKIFILMAVFTIATFGSVAASHASGHMAKGGIPAYTVSRLIGDEVKDPGGTKLGVITDFVLDSQGRVEFAILYDRAQLEYGRKHVEGKYVAVPFDALSISKSPAKRETVVLDVEKQTLDYAPRYLPMDLRNPVWDAGVYQYYGEYPYWTQQRAGGDLVIR